MKKQKKPSVILDSISLSEFFAILFALGYMQSVLTVANHVSMWVHNGAERTVPAPSLPALVIGLLLVCFSCYKRKGRFTALTIISLTIFATASIFWLSGLRTNFYF